MKYDKDLYVKKLLETFCAFHELCKSNNLKYSVAYGTMLGAIRHKGLIPWDDDIDVIMPRPDYDKLIQMAKMHKIGGHYDVFCSQTYKHYNLYFAKFVDLSTTLIEVPYDKDCIIGVFVDIFPMDAVPEDKESYEKLWQKIHKYSSRAHLASFHPSKYKSWGHKIKSIYFHLFSNRRKLFLKTDQLAASYGYDNSNKISVFANWERKEQIYDKKIFDELIEVDFEKMKVCCISSYDSYLKTSYGDYMTPPPIEKQVSVHEQYFIDLEHRYNKNEVKQILKTIK